MSTHSYSLRNRLGNTTATNKTPTNSPYTKPVYRSPRKPSIQGSVLKLKHVIGTTTTTPGGLSSCRSTNCFAYCAGSVAVLAEVNSTGSINYRYFKARPTATALNPTSPHYESVSNSNTPTRRTSVFAPKRAQDDISGKGFGRDWLDETNGSTWSARERIKAVTCVSLSPDGRLLAVGETGYNPRVLLFSTSASSTDIPLSIMTEHSFGVRNVAFSPDSKYLATLGDINDGFLYIWTVNSKTGEVRLRSTNKCTSNICDMTWCGNNVVTVGTRHIKIWQISVTPRTSPQKRAQFRMEGEQVPSPGPTPLQGRNCLLGTMVDATFTAVTTVSSDRAVVSADDGCVCLLDLSNANAVLTPTLSSDGSATTISYHSGTESVIWTSGGNLQQKEISCPTLSLSIPNQTYDHDSKVLRPRSSKRSLLRESLALTQPGRASNVALVCLDDGAIAIDADGSVHWLPIGEAAAKVGVSKLSSHSNLIRGVQQLPEMAGSGSFFTWAKDGEVRFWDLEGDILRTEKFELDHLHNAAEDEVNELKVVHYVAALRRFVTGDKYGVVRLVDQDSWATCQIMRAHGAEVTAIAVHEGTSMLATCSKDRMVQLFRIDEQGAELLQTADDHISAVHHILFSTDGARLLSCSADRTIVVRERLERQLDGQATPAFVSTRIVTLKGSPLSMSLLPNNQNTLFVSTMDRYVVKVDVSTGATMDAFKVADRDTDDTATLNSICLSTSDTTSHSPVLAGYSSTDKSIRLYDTQKGVLLDRDAGHTEGISDMILFEHEDSEKQYSHRAIISTGLDRTIMIWSIATPAQSQLAGPSDTYHLQTTSSGDLDVTPVKQSPASLPPLRKVLSKIDVAELTRQSSPTRETSPHAVKRKTSKLALSTPIEEADENILPDTTQRRAKDRQTVLERRSPSPPARPVMRLGKQRSYQESGTVPGIKKTKVFEHSPSPPPAPSSMPSSPKHKRASNGRLRRPPSIPSDFRAEPTIPQRRQSIAVSTDSGNMVTASEATCRMLRTFRKKLQSSQTDVDLDEVEKELETLLRTIRQRKGRTIEMNAHGESHNQRETTTEIEGLTALLNSVGMNT